MKKGKTIFLTGSDLDFHQIRKIMFEDYEVKADMNAMKSVESCREKIIAEAASGALIYGFNMGFGQNQDVQVDSEGLAQLQTNLIRSHAISFGDAAPEQVVKLTMVLRANALLKGYSGVRREVISKLLEFVNNKNFYPFVPKIGSLGASGDLSPLSHVALNLIGEGECFLRDGNGNFELVEAKVALKRENIQPLLLESKEGLALNNGMQFTTAYLIFLIFKMEKVVKTSLALSACFSEIMLATNMSFDSKIHDVRPYEGQKLAAKMLSKLLVNSDIIKSHRLSKYDPNTQDPYSSRCLPQVFGVVFDALSEAKVKLKIEINSATDNPLVFGNQVISGGNFHGMPIAILAANLFNVFCSQLKIKEALVRRVVDKDKNRLGVSCLLDPECNHQTSSGMMILEYSYHAISNLIMSANNPAFLFSASSASCQEDHVSHAPTVVLNLEKALELFEYSLSLENVMIVQGYNILKKLEQKFKEIGKMPVDGKLSPSAIGSYILKINHGIFEGISFDTYLKPSVEKVRREIIKKDLISHFVDTMLD